MPAVARDNLHAAPFSIENPDPGCEPSALSNHKEGPIRMIPSLGFDEWLMLFLGAAGIGLSKSGFPGISMFHVVVYAAIFGTKESTGLLLPMLVLGDCIAIFVFGRKANWHQVRRLLPPTLAGVVIGWLIMDRMDPENFKQLVGIVILSLIGLQCTRAQKPQWFDQIPNRRWFAVLLGLLAGVTTMLANAAGPVVALYLISVKLPKWELIGTSAWLFLVLNVCKLPLSYDLGLITQQTLLIGLLLAAGIPAGLYLGRWLVERISQKWFNIILLSFTAFAAIRMICLI
jgi:uncharacterized membrane protein YfcA